MSEDIVGPEKLWGAPAVAAAIGTSADFVYKIAGKAGVPIYRPPGTGKVFARRSELNRWLRSNETPRSEPKKTKRSRD